MYKPNKNIVKITITKFGNTILSIVFWSFFIPKHHKSPESDFSDSLYRDSKSEIITTTHKRSKSVTCLLCESLDCRVTAFLHWAKIPEHSHELIWIFLDNNDLRTTQYVSEGLFPHLQRKLLHMIYLKGRPVRTSLESKMVDKDIKPYSLYKYLNTHRYVIYMLYMCSCLNTLPK